MEVVRSIHRSPGWRASAVRISGIRTGQKNKTKNKSTKWNNWEHNANGQTIGLNSLLKSLDRTLGSKSESEFWFPFLRFGFLSGLTVKNDTSASGPEAPEVLRILKVLFGTFSEPPGELLSVTELLSENYITKVKWVTRRIAFPRRLSVVIGTKCIEIYQDHHNINFHRWLRSDREKGTSALTAILLTIKLPPPILLQL